LIADIKSGTSSHIQCSATGSAEAPGSVSSFELDGMILDSNDFNVLGVTYYWFMVADPLQF